MADRQAARGARLLKKQTELVNTWQAAGRDMLQALRLLNSFVGIQSLLVLEREEAALNLLHYKLTLRHLN